MKKLRRSNLSEDAYEFIRELFVNGTRYDPGDKISVEELSRELGVSRTPLWGAINRLEAEGIVEVVPRQGVYLINYDPDRVLEIYVAREALEGMAARLVAALPIAKLQRCRPTSMSSENTWLRETSAAIIRPHWIFTRTLCGSRRTALSSGWCSPFWLRCAPCASRATMCPCTCRNHATITKKS
jgi:DNA-binding GntR family transcriptional regulator